MVYWYFIATSPLGVLNLSSIYSSLLPGLWNKACFILVLGGGGHDVSLIGASYLWGWEQKSWGVKSITRRGGSLRFHALSFVRT